MSEIEHYAGCVVYDELNDLVLLVQSQNLEKGKWGHPGGRIEQGETAIEAAIREVKEEINLDVMIQEEDFIGKYSADLTTLDGGVQQGVFSVYGTIYYIGEAKPAGVPKMLFVPFNEVINSQEGRINIDSAEYCFKPNTKEIAVAFAEKFF